MSAGCWDEHGKSGIGGRDSPSITGDAGSISSGVTTGDGDAAATAPEPESPGSKKSPNLPERICEELLLCQICYGRFTLAKMPKLLGCSHTFCEPCIRRYTWATQFCDNSFEGCNKFPCPVCREETTLPQQGVNALPNNYTVLGLIDIFDHQTRKSASLQGNDLSNTAGSLSQHDMSNNYNKELAMLSAKVTGSLTLNATEPINKHTQCVGCASLNIEVRFPCSHPMCKDCLRQIQSEPGSSGELRCILCADDSMGNSIKRNPCDVCLSSLTESLPFPCGHTVCNNCLSDKKYDKDTLKCIACSINSESIYQSRKPINTRPGPIARPLSYIQLRHEGIYGNNNTSTQAPLYEAVSNTQQQQQRLYESAGNLTNVKSNNPTMTRKDQERTPPFNPTYQGRPPADGSPIYGTITHARNQARNANNDIYSSPTLYRPRVPPRTESPSPIYGPLYRTVSNLSTSNTFSPGRKSRTLLPILPRRASTSFLYGTLGRRSMSCPTTQATAPSKLSLVGDTISAPTSPHNFPKPACNPPKPPPRRINAPQGMTAVKCVSRIGRYSEVKMQTSTFSQPTRVAYCEQCGFIAVVDAQGMTVQIFYKSGEYMSMFKVLGIQGLMFLTAEKLALATHRGIELFKLSGEKISEIPSGLVINLVPYKFGILACKPRSLIIYKQSLALHKTLTKYQVSRARVFKKSKPFLNIRDVSANSLKDILVLDAGLSQILVLNEDGVLKMAISPHIESCGIFSNPYSLAVDKMNSILLSDTANQRVLKFSATGSYSRCLIDFMTAGLTGLLSNAATGYVEGLSPHGIASTEDHLLIAVVTGDQFAEIQVFKPTA